MPRISPAMADGRAFTTYVSSGLAAKSLAARLGAANETQFRHILEAQPEAGMLPWARPPSWMPARITK